jgi:hypothetical protein
MRILILLFFFVWCAFFLGTSQGYSPFAVEGAHWEMWDGGCYLGCDGVVTYPRWESTYRFKLEGDTTVNGILCKKLFESEHHTYYYALYQQNISISRWYLTALLWEDTALKRVYFKGAVGGCQQNSADDSLLFDFSKSVGDSLKANYIDFNNVNKCDTNYNYVDSVSYSLQFTFMRKTFYLQPADSGNARYHLIEGIGASYGLFGGPGAAFEGSYSSMLNRYCIGSDIACWGDFIPVGVAAIKPGESVNVFPDPVNGILSVESETDYDEVELYNLLGASCYHNVINTRKQDIDVSALNSGIYFCKLHFPEDVYIHKFVIAH